MTKQQSNENSHKANDFKLLQKRTTKYMQIKESKLETSMIRICIKNRKKGQNDTEKKTSIQDSISHYQIGKNCHTLDLKLGYLADKRQ